METPILLLNKEVLSAVNTLSNHNSSVIDVSEATKLALQIVWTGTPGGSVSINGSNDGVTFTELSSYTLVGANGSKFLSDSSASYVFCKITYTTASAAGSLTCRLSAKK